MVLCKIKYLKIALLVCLIHEVVSYPKLKPAKRNGKNNKKSKTKNIHEYQREGIHDDAGIRGSIEIDNGNVEGRIQLNDDLIQDNTGYNGGDNNKPKGDVITGNININDQNIEGVVEFPDGVANGNDVEEAKPGSKKQSNEDTIKGNIEINQDNIEGTVEFPDNAGEHKSNNQAANIKKTGGSDTKFNEDAITGNIEINKDNIEGQIELPDGVISGQNEGNKEMEKYAMQNDNTEDAIVGDINIGKENIEGEIIIPDKFDTGDDTNVKHVNTPKSVVNPASSENQGNKDTISGKVIIDNDGNIEGTIEVPDDNGTGNTNNIQDGDKDAIHGTIEIKDDGGIEGNINVPDSDNVNNNNKNQNGDGDFFTGSIEINEGGIKGSVNVPDGNDNVNFDGNTKTENKKDGDISGEVIIDDKGNLEGQISLPDVELSNNSQFKHKDTPSNNVASNPNKNNKGNSDITGEVIIDDNGNIEGQISLPDGENSKPFNKIKNDPLETPYINSQKNSHKSTKENCWMNLNSKHYLDALDETDATYIKARREYHDEIGPNFDKQMMEVLLKSQGKASRAIHQAFGNPNLIPAGLNLGGFNMMRMPGSMLFFHRMKLRNSTVFRVDFLEADLMHMSLVGRLSLNDLHLRGAYERATTEGDMSLMYFIPSYGELDVLIKSAKYRMEGRLRMLNNRLMIEVINSHITTSDIMLWYANTTATGKNVALESIDDFIVRIKCDLDLWLKDYFNDYLMYFGIVGSGKNSDIHLYEKHKTIKANEHADHVIKGIKKRLRDIKAANVKIPSVTLLSVMDHRIELKNGVLRGLDSIYRRSVGMTKKENNVRILDMMVGFSNLKVQYQYEATVKKGMPPLTGLVILTADDLTAHFAVSQVTDSQIVDINVDSIMQLRPETLTVEGPANRLIADFKHLLENPIIAIMTNVIKHNIKMLKTLPRCEPTLFGFGSEHNPYDNAHHIPEYYSNDKIVSDGNGNVKEMKSHEAFTDNEKSPGGKPLNKEWADYTFSKNDSVEVEVPINGKVQKMLLKRNENFVLSKKS